MARDIGITPGSEDWCDIWLCNLLSRYFYGPITIVRQSSAEGKGWGEVLAPKVTCRLLGGRKVRGMVRLRGQDGLATAGRGAGAPHNSRAGRWGGTIVNVR